MPISRQNSIELAAELIMLSDKILITISNHDICSSSELIDLCMQFTKKMRHGYYFLIEQDPYGIQFFEPGKTVNFITDEPNAIKSEYEYSKALTWIYQPGSLTIINLSTASLYSRINIITRSLKSPKINTQPDLTNTNSADSINIGLPPLESILKITAELRSNGWLTD